MAANTTLGGDSTVTELFEAFELPEGTVNVLPATVTNDKDDTRLMILIRGEHNTASFIMAELMARLQELYDYAEQEEAKNESVIERI